MQYTQYRAKEGDLDGAILENIVITTPDLSGYSLPLSFQC